MSVLGMGIQMEKRGSTSGSTFVIVAFAAVGVMWIVFANSYFVGAAFIALSLGYLIYVLVQSRRVLKETQQEQNGSS
jgi:membrane protein implicated in regulation of membrane protease activity